MPERFLLKVLRPMVTARILHSLKGPNGGYNLARPPNRITLLEVLEAVDGPICNLYEPSAGTEGAAVDRKIQAVFDVMNESVRGKLAKVSIGDLMSGKGRGK